MRHSMRCCFRPLTPLCVWSALQGDEKHVAFALLGAFWLPVVALLGYRHNKNVLGVVYAAV